MAKYPCRNCVYFNTCGDSARTMPCEGRTTKTQRKAYEKEMCQYVVRNTKAIGINIPEVIDLQDVQKYAEEFMNGNEIDHHASDLYLKVTPISKAIVGKLANRSLLTTFIDNIEGQVWYELPFCYHGKEVRA